MNAAIFKKKNLILWSLTMMRLQVPIHCTRFHEGHKKGQLTYVYYNTFLRLFLILCLINISILFILTENESSNIRVQ